MSEVQITVKRKTLSTSMNRSKCVHCILDFRLISESSNTSDQCQSSGFSRIIPVYIPKGPFLCIRPDIRVTGKEQGYRHQAKESTGAFMTKMKMNQMVISFRDFRK